MKIATVCRIESIGRKKVKPLIGFLSKDFLDREISSIEPSNSVCIISVVLNQFDARNRPASWVFLSNQPPS